MLRRFEEGREGMTAVSFYYGYGTWKIQLNGSWEFLVVKEKAPRKSVMTLWARRKVMSPHGFILLFYFSNEMGILLKKIDGGGERSNVPFTPPLPLPAEYAPNSRKFMINLPLFDVGFHTPIPSLIENLLTSRFASFKAPADISYSWTRLFGLDISNVFRVLWVKNSVCFLKIKSLLKLQEQNLVQSLLQELFWTSSLWVDISGVFRAPCKTWIKP